MRGGWTPRGGEGGHYTTRFGLTQPGRRLNGAGSATTAARAAAAGMTFIAAAAGAAGPVSGDGDASTTTAAGTNANSDVGGISPQFD